MEHTVTKVVITDTDDGEFQWARKWSGKEILSCRDLGIFETNERTIKFFNFLKKLGILIIRS